MRASVGRGFAPPATRPDFKVTNLSGQIKRYISGKIKTKVVYDPSDLRTLYQDANGKIPVTSNGDPVGLMLDKSQGLQLGPELIVNGSFDSDISGWSHIGGSSHVVNGQVTVVNDVTEYARIAQSFNCVVGRMYLVAADYVGGDAPGKLDITNVTSLSSTTAKRMQFLFAATSTTHQVFLQNNNNTSGRSSTWDNVSVREVKGCHAAQSISASRPIYRRGDSRGVVNLLKWTEDLTRSPWGLRGFTALSTTAIAPDGSSTAIRVKEDGTNSNVAIWYSQGLNVSSPQTFQVWLRADTPMDIHLSTQGALKGPAFSVTAEWKRFEVTQSRATVTGPHIGGFLTIPQHSGVEFEVWHPQLEHGSAATEYQRNNEHLGGVATGSASDLHWLEFDDIDDWMYYSFDASVPELWVSLWSTHSVGNSYLFDARPSAQTWEYTGGPGAGLVNITENSPIADTYKTEIFGRNLNVSASNIYMMCRNSQNEVLGGLMYGWVQLHGGESSENRSSVELHLSKKSGVA